MPSSTFSGSVSSPKIGFSIETGNPFLDRTIDGFLKIGTVALARAAAEETFHMARKGSVSKNSLEHSLTKMCKEGAYWGTVAGVYVGMEYGVGRARGSRDWTNAMLGGALTGALVGVAGNDKNKDNIVISAITGAAIATAAEFINYLV